MSVTDQIERAATALQQLVADGVAARKALFPDLRWAERIVEKQLRGLHLSPAVLKMARDALTEHGRLERVEIRIRDEIAAERDALTVQPRFMGDAQ